MDWLKRMNDALSYMEENLGGEISIEKAAQLACCSQYHLQRMFSYIIGVPLSEYIRRRRLTKAAFDLQNGDKVIEVARRYGYYSPTAFNRAFQAIHGISPSAAQRADTALKAFPRVSFQITVRGVTEMEYRIAEKEEFRVVGIRMKLADDVEENAGNIMSFWEEAGKKGLLGSIISLINGEPSNLLGLLINEDGGGYYHICAATDMPVPKGMFEVRVPKHTWAIFPGYGKPLSIVEMLRRIYSEWYPTSNYEFAANIDMEVYLSMSMNPNDNIRYEVWMPVVKRN